MATCVGLSGFETFYAPHGGQDQEDQNVFDILKSRSGVGYYRQFLTVAGATSGVRFGGGGGGAWPVPIISAGQQGKCRTRFFVRVVTPFSAQRPLFYVRFGNVANNIGILLKPDRTFALFFTPAGTSLIVGTASINIAPVVSGTWDQWVQIDLTITGTENGVSDSVGASATVTFPNGEVEALTINTGAPANYGTANFDGFVLAPNTLPMFTASVTMDVHYDDWWMASATDADVAALPDFPVGTRITRCCITGQGADDEWTNDWWNVAKPSWLGTFNDNHQSSASVGLKTTFTHQTAAELGITGSVYGIMLYQESRMSSGGGATSKFRVAGVTFDSHCGLSTGISAVWGCKMTTWSASQFDTIHYGVESPYATEQRLYAMTAEVLHDGLAKPPIYLNLGAGYRHQWVSYTGNGTSQKIVTGVGFRPTWMMVVPFSHAQGVHVRPVAIPWALTHSGIETPQGIISMDEDGFTLGTSNINLVNQTYAALCVRDDGILDGLDYVFHFRSGSICGNDQIEVFSHSSACKPKLLLIAPSGTAAGPTSYFKTDDTGALTPRLNQAGAAITIGTTLDANGFRIGASTTIMNGTDWGAWAIWSDSPEVAQFVAVGEIAPAVVDTVVPVTTLTQPLYMVNAKGNNTNEGGVRLNEAAYGGLLCSGWLSGNISLTSRLIALDNTSFTVDGTAGSLLTGTVECWWFALAGAGQIEPPGEYEFDPDELVSIGLVWVEAYLPD